MSLIANNELQRKRLKRNKVPASPTVQKTVKR